MSNLRNYFLLPESATTVTTYEPRRVTNQAGMDIVLTVMCYELQTFDLIILCLNGIVRLREQVVVLCRV
jgi:hypothetical protein